MTTMLRPARLLLIVALALLLCALAIGFGAGRALAQEEPLPAGQICRPTLLPISGAASRAVNSEPALNDDGSRAVFWSTSNPVGRNDDGSIEVFIADTTILSPTVPGRTVRQVTESRGNILGGFNLMPDVTRGVVGSAANAPVRTYAVFASDRDLEPGRNADGGFEIFLAQTEPQLRIWQITNTRQSSSILPTISDIVGRARVRISFVSENGPGSSGEVPSGGDDDRNYEVFVMTLVLTGSRPAIESIRQITQTPAPVANDQPAISPDGARVVWLSSAWQPLLPGSSFTPNNGSANTSNREVFLATLPLNATAATPVAFRQVTLTGTAVENDRPDVSRNADRIVFSSTALNPGSATSSLSTPSVFVARATSATAYTHQRLSAAVRTPSGRTLTAKEPTISADARRIAFVADGCDPDLEGACRQPQGVFQLFVADQGAATSTQFSLAQVTTGTGRTNESPSISGDGSYVTLVTTLGSGATNPDLSGSEVIFLDCPVARLEPQKSFRVLTGSLSPLLPDVGDTVQYSVTLANRSLSDFRDTMVMTDVLPAGLVNISVVPPAPPAGTTITPPVYDPEEGTVQWSVTNLRKGGRATVLIRGVVAPGQGGNTITNRVFITTTAAEVETGLIIVDPFTELSFDVTQVDLRAGLALSKNVVREGENFDIVLRVANTSTTESLNPATNVRVTTDLPSRAALAYVTHTAGESYNPATGVWTIGRIDPGATATLRITVRARPGSGGQPTFDVGITAFNAPEQEDANPGNTLVSGNIRRALRVIGTDLQLISKSVSPTRPPTGARVTYSIVVRNNGPLGQDALYNANRALFIPNTVVITDVLPTGLSFINGSPGAAAVGQTIIWRIPGWGEGSGPTGDFTRTVTVTAQVLAAAGTEITNRVEGVQGAYTSSGQPIMNDPVPGNNAPANITATFRVNSPAEAVVSLRPSSNVINEGTLITATLVYTDQDPLDTHNVTLNWGDGSPAETRPNVVREQPPVGPLNLSKTLVFTHTYADDPPTGPDQFIIRAFVTDSNGLGSAPASAIINVNNVPPITRPPVVTGFALRSGNTYIVTPNTTLTATMTFTDPGFTTAWSSERFYYRVNWGDGQQIPSTLVPGTQNGRPGVASSGTVRVSHPFVATGTFTVSLYVDDDDFVRPTPSAQFRVIVSVRPQGVNDTLTVTEDQSASLNVLANDVQGAPLSLQQITTPPITGTIASFAPSGVVTYTASGFNALRQGQTATDRFTYLARDTLGFTTTARVDVTITGVSDRPVVDLSGPGVPGVTTTVTFVEDQPAPLLAPNVTIVDPDSTSMSSARITLINRPDGALERLLIPAVPPLTATYDAGTGVLSLNGAAPVATYRTALASVAYTNTSNTPATASRAVQFIVADETPLESLPVTATVIIQPTDDPPVVRTSPGNTPAIEGQPVIVDSAVTITDTDNPIFVGGNLTVAITGADSRDRLTITAGNGITSTTTAAFFQGTQIGTIAGWRTGNLVVTLNANATVTATQALARQVTYERQGQGNPPPTRTAVFTVRSSATGASSAPASKVIEIQAVNDPPAIRFNPFPTVPEDVATNIHPSIVITDPDALNGTLVMTVQVANGTLTWSAGATGNNTNRIIVSGTLAQLNAPATTLNYQGNAHFNGVETLTVAVNDQGNTPPPPQSALTSTTFTVAPVNDAPTLSPLSFNAAFIEGNGPVLLAPTITVQDVDGPASQITQAFAVISGGFAAGQDVLAATVIPPIQATYSTTGLLTLTGNASPADYQTVLRSITYNNTSSNPSTAARTIQIAVRDEALTSAPAVVNLTVTAVNNPPIITLSDLSLPVTENAAATVVDPTAGFTDTDSTVFPGAVLTVTVDEGDLADQLGIETTGGSPISVVGLSVRHQGTAFATLTAAPPRNQLIFTFNAGNVATTARVRDLLRRITYRRFRGSDESVRFVTMTMREAGVSAVGSDLRQINITSVNDAPEVTIAPISAVEETPVAIAATIRITDVDAAAGTLTFTASVTSGVLTANVPGGSGVTPEGVQSGARIVVQGTESALRAWLATAANLSYQGAPNFTGNVTLTVAVNDQGNTPGPVVNVTTVTRVFTVSGANDPPVIVLTPITTPEDTPVAIATSIAITDIDVAAVQMTLTATVSSGRLTATVAGGAVLVGPASGTTVAVNGTLTQLRTMLATATNLRFGPAPNATGSVTLTVTLNDRGGTPAPPRTTSQSTTITVQPVNDAPRVAIAPFGGTEDTPLSLGARVAITDIDAGPGALVLTASVSSGVLTATVAPAGGVTPEGAQSGARIVVQGTEGALRSWLAADTTLRYQGAPNITGAMALTVTVNDQGNTPAPPLTGQDVESFTLAAVDDPPQLTVNTGLTISFATVGQVITVTIPITSLSATDVDSTPAQINFALVTLPITGTLVAVPPAGPAVPLTTCATPATGIIPQSAIAAGQIRFRYTTQPGSRDVPFGFTVQNGTACPGVAASSYVLRLRGP